MPFDGAYVCGVCYGYVGDGVPVAVADVECRGGLSSLFVWLQKFDIVLREGYEVALLATLWQLRSLYILIS